MDEKASAPRTAQLLAREAHICTHPDLQIAPLQWQRSENSGEQETQARSSNDFLWETKPFGCRRTREPGHTWPTNIFSCVGPEGGTCTDTGEGITSVINNIITVCIKLADCSRQIDIEGS